jgi:acyl-CoA synthetase (AMP-forming)/AMP-acid ligase II
MMNTFDSPQTMLDPTVNKFIGNRIYSPAPAYHISGILIGLQGPVWQGTTFIPGPALRLPSSALVGQILRYGEIEGIVSSPSMIRDFSRDPEMLLRLQSMKSLSWAGGPLDKATGDVLCRHAKLSSAFGSTELGPLFNRASADPTD